MPKSVVRAWTYGSIFALALFVIGSVLNFKTSTIAAPACENHEQVDYIGCPAAEGSKYYVTGWPNEMYCYSDGKDSCSPWNDFLRIERNHERFGLWRQNLELIAAFSVISGLLVTAIALTRNQMSLVKHENSRD